MIQIFVSARTKGFLSSKGRLTALDSSSDMFALIDGHVSLAELEVGLGMHSGLKEVGMKGSFLKLRSKGKYDSVLGEEKEEEAGPQKKKKKKSTVAV